MDKGSWEYDLYENSVLVREILEDLNRSELIGICKQHGLRGYSKLNKEALIHRLETYIMDPAVIHNYLLCLSDDEAAYVRMAAKTGGVVEDAEPEAFSYLIVGGYAGFSKNLDFGIAAELIEAFEIMDTPEFEAERGRICRIGNYCHVANYLYGVTPPMQVVKIFNQYERKKTNWDEVMEVYNLIAKYRCDFVYLDCYFVDMAFINSYEELLNTQGNVPYYMPTREQVDNWCTYGFTPDTHELRLMYEYMVSELWVDGPKAEDICFMLENTIRVGCNLDGLTKALKHVGIWGRTRRQEQEFSSFIKGLVNNSRMLIYRGHTPGELHK